MDVIIVNNNLCCPALRLHLLVRHFHIRNNYRRLDFHQKIHPPNLTLNPPVRSREVGEGVWVYLLQQVGEGVRILVTTVSSDNF